MRVRGTGYWVRKSNGQRLPGNGQPPATAEATAVHDGRTEGIWTGKRQWSSADSHSRRTVLPAPPKTVYGARMRPLEALFVAAAILTLLLRWIQPRNRQVTATLLAMIGIFAVLHLVFDSWRWEMLPAYAMGVAAMYILARDLQRISDAKAGESARWMAVPSTGQRALWGGLLVVAAV